jgi:hypothetical protein
MLFQLNFFILLAGFLFSVNAAAVGNITPFEECLGSIRPILAEITSLNSEV